jgi:hypothetical protein
VELSWCLGKEAGGKHPEGEEDHAAMEGFVQEEEDVQGNLLHDGNWAGLKKFGWNGHRKLDGKEIRTALAFCLNSREQSSSLLFAMSTKLSSFLMENFKEKKRNFELC